MLNNMLLMALSSVVCSVRDLTLPLGGPQKVISIISATDFCMFLPPNRGQSIASSEGYPHASEAESLKFVSV